MKVRVELPVILYADVQLPEETPAEEVARAAKSKIFGAIGSDEDDEDVGLKVEAWRRGLHNVTVYTSERATCDSEEHFKIVGGRG